MLIRVIIGRIEQVHHLGWASALEFWEGFHLQNYLFISSPSRAWMLFTNSQSTDSYHHAGLLTTLDSLELMR
jgi:hypothetical protein